MMNPSPIRIRDAGPKEFETIVEYNRKLASESEELELDAETVTAGVKALLADPSKGKYFFAEVDGRVVGQLMTTFEWSDWRNGTFLWIQSVYVEADYRRRGVFRALYDHVKVQSSEAGMCGIRLYVHDENGTAETTYRKLGMVSPGYLVLETPDELRE